MEILKIESIGKRYGAIQAVNDLSLTINRGEVYGILGPNGSGKTTTLGIILGVIRSDTGFFAWNIPVDRIGALLETPNFYPYLSLKKNLEITALIKNIDFSEIDIVLEKVGLSERKNSKFYSLSLGMRQRLALANVLLGNPEVLVLDEPTNGLDPQGIADVRQLITNEAKNGKTIILASHLLDEVQKVCSHVAVLKKGEILRKGAISDLLQVKHSLILSSEENERLYELLVRSGLFEKVSLEGDNIYLDLGDKMTAKEVNEFAFKHNIVLTRFEIQESSLESEFLKMVE